MSHASNHPTITLDGFSLDEAFEIFLDFDRTWSVIPHGCHHEIEAAWNRIQNAANVAGITTLKVALDRLPALLRNFTYDGAALSRFADAATSAKVHQHRNLFTAVTLASAANFGADLEPVYKATDLALHPRTTAVNRPCELDEIILLRTHAILLTERDDADQLKTAGILALSDAGLLVKETTEITRTDFIDVDDDLKPAAVVALGNSVTTDRLVMLDPFAQHISAAVINGRPAKGALLYTPRKDENLPGSAKAQASATGVITTAFKHVGLHYADLAPGSVRAWRIAHTWEHVSGDAACEISGMNETRTERLAHRQRPLATPVTASVTRF